MGVLFVNYTRPHIFLAQERRLIETSASQATNAFQLAAAQEARIGQLQALYDAAVELTKETERGAIYRKLVTQAYELTGISGSSASYAALLLSHPREDTLTVSEVYPEPMAKKLKPRQGDTVKLADFDNGLVRLYRAVIAREEAVLIDDIQELRQFAPCHANAAAVIGVPLHDATDKRLIGVFYVGHCGRKMDLMIPIAICSLCGANWSKAPWKVLTMWRNSQSARP